MPLDSIIETPPSRTGPVDVYIAGPFFNLAQVLIIARIEAWLSQAGHSFYSPRLHSGSAALSQEEKRDPKAWDPVFASNVYHLYNCGLLLAVVEWAMPEYQALHLCQLSQQRDAELPRSWEIRNKVELPDSGTVWEMGFVRGWNAAAQFYTEGHEPRIPIIGFHSSKLPAQLNLMLVKGVHGNLTGWDAFEKFFDHSDFESDDHKQRSFSIASRCGIKESYAQFDFTALSGFEGVVE
jgi:nucleoside 2-deoxyribosyltransferase